MIVKYLSATGEILYIVDSDDNLDLYNKDNNHSEGAILTPTEKPFESLLKSKYVNDGVLKSRPTCPAYLDGLVLKLVPIGSKIIIDGETYTADSDNVTLNFPFAGTYHVTIIPPFPYLEKEFTIDYQP